MAKRKSVPQSIRFEVFKRDSFTCQYCGHKAPDVLLVIDHIQPVSKGGTNDILNLTTSCKDCNSGKSNKQLNETTIIDKQRFQLEELQERKEQLTMMFKWQKGLLSLDSQLIDQLANFWSEQVAGFQLSETGLKILKALKRKYEIDEIMTAMKIAADHYLRFEDGSPTKDSVELAWSKISGVCYNRRRDKDQPHLQKLFYIRGILKNRLSYFDLSRGLRLLEDAFDVGASLDSLEKCAKDARSWTQWRNVMEDFIAQHKTSSEKS